jgi:hypothetical protein
MRSCILFLLLCFLVIPKLHLLAQINDITHLQFQNPAETLFESAPVIISENEVMIFYINSTKDTILSVTSGDGGTSWEIPVGEIDIELGTEQSYTYLTALCSSSGRILVAWADRNQGMLILSDDKGITWSEPQIIVSVGVPSFSKLENINLSQVDDGRILLGYNDNFNRNIYFIQSSDDGATWNEDAKEVYTSQPFTINGLTVVSSTGENLVAVFEFKVNSSSGIYKCISTDNGVSWGDTVRIANSGLDESRPKIVKRLDGSLLLTYLREHSTQIAGFNQTDIYYTISSDGGETWQEEKRFTKYVGKDDFINISHLNGKTFISFASQRFTNNFQISYGLVEETVETYTPPFVVSNEVSFAYDSIPADFTFRSIVIDDDQVANVDLEIEDMLISGSLYDDGMHDDLEANDNVWGNIFPFVIPRNSSEYNMAVNKIILPFNNKGVLADTEVLTVLPAIVNSSDIDNYKSTVVTFHSFHTLNTSTLGKYEEDAFLFSAGFFLSGYNDGELWSNAVASASLVQDYLPGKIDTDPEDNLHVIYTINKDDPPFGLYWLKWKDAVELGAEFYDGDGDGIYNPVDKNWNGTWDPNEDMPALIGDETSWCVYNDAQPKEKRRWNTVDPLGIEIKQTLFATNHPDLEEVLFIKYSLLNTGLVNDVMDSVYFGVWEDADLGDHTDDVIGCDTLLNSGYTYNNTPDSRYGDNCPAFFTTVLQGPVYLTGESSDTAKINYGILLGSEIISGAKNLELTSHVFHIGGDPNLQDPGTKFAARNYLEGKDRLGNFPDPCTFPYCEVKGGVNCNEVDPHFWASGDPVTDVGWISVVNEDIGNLISTGLFRLEKDKPQEIIIAYVLGRGTDYFNSITVARENVRRAIDEYKSNFASMTYTPPPPANPVTDYILYHNYPNPFNPTTTIRYELPQDGVVTIKIYDILGQEVATILNEFKKADRYEIEFNSIGLASGVYIYRMKVNEFIASKKMILLR